MIFITPFDPFDRNRMVYTIRNMCEEVPDLPYDDGARTLFLYTRGTEGNPPEELRQFLHYMEQTDEENAVNDTLRKVDEMVNIVKQDKEVGNSYMKVWEREEQCREEGREEGRKEERAHTEFEKNRADREKSRADLAEQELAVLRERLSKYEAV